MLFLKPSEIYYSQGSISAYFGRSTDHPFQPIGKALDQLCEGSLSVNDIPRIKVTKKDDDGKWYTIDNRRLWIFRHLEGAGKCTYIPCEEVSFCIYAHGHKFDSTNGGVSVTFFGGRDPGGVWHTIVKPADPVIPADKPSIKSTISADSSDESSSSDESVDYLALFVKKLGL